MSSQNASLIVQASFAQGIAEANGLAARAGRIIMAPGALSFEVGQGAFGGIGQTLSNTASTVTNSDWFTASTSTPMIKKVINHVVPSHTLRGDYAFKQAGLQLAAAAIATMDKGFFDGLEGLFAAAHPRQGVGDGQVGAAKSYLDAGLVYNGGTQDNLLAAAALTEANLNLAVRKMLAYRSDRGVPLHLGTSGGLVLVVDPQNAQVAHELVRSQVSGSDMASNFVNGLISDVVVYPLTTDSDDWFLIDKANAPVGLAIGEEATARISTTTNGLLTELTAEVSFCFFKSPYEYGIIGANVA